MKKTSAHTIGGISRTLWAALLAASLVACGGGGGTAATDTTTSDTLVSGVAAKGILKKAKISIFPLNADGSVSTTALATTTTLDDGSYTIKIIGGYSGVVVTQVDLGTETTMIDEATGATVSNDDLKANFTPMRAALEVTKGATPAINVNPYTEIAVTTALADTSGAGANKISLDKVTTANTKVTTSIGVDPVSASSSFDSTDPTKPASPLAAQLAALSKIAASDSTTQSSVGCTVDSGATTAAKIKCVVDALNKKDSLVTATGSDAEVARKAIEDAASQMVEDKGAAVAPPKTNDPTKAVPVTDTTQKTAMEATKTFFSNLAGNWRALKADRLSLDSSYKGIKDKMSARTEPASGIMIDVIKMATYGPQLWADVKVNKTRSFPSGGSVSFNSGSRFNIGASCTFFSDDAYSTLATELANANYLFCSVSERQDPTNQDGTQAESCAAKDDVCHYLWTTGMRITPTSTANQYTVDTKTYKRTITLNENLQKFEDKTSRKFFGGATADAGGKSLIVTGTPSTDTSSKAQYTNVTLVGELSPNWKIVSDGYRDSSNKFHPRVLGIMGDKHEINLAANISALTGTLDGAGVKKLTLSGLIDLYKKGDAATMLESKLQLLEGSYLQFETDADGKDINGANEKFSLNLKVTSLDGGFTGSVTGSNYSLDAAGKNGELTKIVLNGSLLDANGKQLFNGSVTAEDTNHVKFDISKPLSSTNYQTASLTLVGDMAIPDRKPINITVKVTATGAKAAGGSPTGTVSGQYTQNGLTMLFSGTDTDSTSDAVTFSNTNGVAVSIKRGDKVVDVTKSGTKVGTFDLQKSWITYSDGTYNTF